MRSRIIPKEEINFRIIFSVDIVLVSENDQSYGLPGLDDAEKIKCGINQRDCERERGGETQPIHTHTGYSTDFTRVRLYSLHHFLKLVMRSRHLTA